MTDAPPLHEALRPLRGLLGTFTGQGRGDYPTIEPFGYHETVTFGHVGKPFLTYAQRTTHAVEGTPLHAECGYLRHVGDGNLELVLAHPTGIVEVEEGQLETAIDVLALELRTTAIGTSSTAKDVRGLRRRLVLDGDELRYDLWMAHADTPETHHLAARLRRTG